MKKANEREIQNKYYAATAHKYDSMHYREKDEHQLALSFLVGVLDFFEINSVLDVGSGTGRVLRFLKDKKPAMKLMGVEPSKELREIGYQHGLSRDEIVDGVAEALPFQNEAFDLVCEFGVLHHVKQPQFAVAEMLRVAKKAIFISDANNFGQGSWFVRSLKQLINSLGLWGVVNFMKTGGKGFIVSEGDGQSYSYSAFNNYRQIKERCKIVYVVNTRESNGINLYRTASTVAFLGIKK